MILSYPCIFAYADPPSECDAQEQDWQREVGAAQTFGSSDRDAQVALALQFDTEDLTDSEEDPEEPEEYEERVKKARRGWRGGKMNRVKQSGIAAVKLKRFRELPFNEEIVEDDAVSAHTDIIIPRLI